MTRALLAKEAREHGWIILALLILEGLGYAGFAADARDDGSAFIALKYFAITFGGAGAVIVANRLVVRESSGRIQLFLETLPVKRLRVIAVKAGSGLALTTCPILLALIASALLAWDFPFMLWFEVRKKEGTAAFELPIFRLLDDRTPFERHLFPWPDFGLAVASGSVLVAGAVVLASGRSFRWATVGPTPSVNLAKCALRGPAHLAYTRLALKLNPLIIGGVLLAAAVPTTVVAVVAVTYAHGITTPILVASAVGLALALGLALTVARRVTGPLDLFRAFAMNIAQGKFGGQVEHRSEDELGELAKTLNYMSASIEAYDAETQRLADDVEAGYLETIVALANSLDSKDPYTRGHGQRVAELAVAIGRKLKLSEQELKELKYGGILHDIGKIGIVETILLKQTRLDDSEMETMRAHPLIGDHIIKPVRLLSSVRAAVRNHHEWWDGTGYPDKLKGEAIPLQARIIAAADTWDACTSTRPYQVALAEEDALAVVDKLTGRHLDPSIAPILKQVIVERKGGAQRARTDVKPESKLEVKKAG